MGKNILTFGLSVTIMNKYIFIIILFLSSCLDARIKPSHIGNQHVFSSALINADRGRPFRLYLKLDYDNKKIYYAESSKNCYHITRQRNDKFDLSDSYSLDS